jgi:hypothetical protein
MAWLLFMDESGHSHKELPYEVRGGFALADTHLWPFVQEVLGLELSCFGARLASGLQVGGERDEAVVEGSLRARRADAGA